MNRAERRSTVPSPAQRAALAQRRRIILLASLAIVAIGLIVAVSLASRVPKTASDAPIKATVAVGQKAPSFAVSTTNGPFDLAGAGGKPTLLEVFASWCPHCQHEVSSLNTIYAAYKNKVNMVAVAGSPYGLDQSQPESQAGVLDFATKFGVRYPIAFDPQLDVAGKYLQGGFPTVVLIGSDGIVQAIRDGEIPKSDIAAALDASLAHKKPSPKMGA
ncbi:MAG: TlpA family protein disulfide reductase [Candidatus Eremiobacteraeota bacterium]|nr:TlpA family protein disulfide reductase [Candidatus Eremiobacteraeota bacterium]